MANLTGKQLVELEIITGVSEANIAQHGVDLNVIQIDKLFGVGFIPKEGKTKLVSYKPLDQELIVVGMDEAGDPIEGSGWMLSPGAYQVKFSQGCKIPADQMLLIRQRSSLLRNGVILHSSVFDAGFQTENMGTIIIVTHPIIIEYGSRIAQIYAHTSNTVENLYQGQFQNDKQRDQK